MTERRALVQPDNSGLSIRRQCELLSLNRSTHYYVPAELSAEETARMRAIDQIFTKWPFYGSRRAGEFSVFFTIRPY